MHPKVAKAKSLADAGRNAEALALLEKLCRKDKRNADAYFLTGLILSKQGNMEAAVKNFKRATIVNPRFSVAYFNQGNASVALGNIEEAIDAYSAAYKLEPGRPEVIAALARSYAGIGDFDRAIEFYKRNLELSPGNPDLAGNIATSYFLNGELENAAGYYQKAIDIKKNASYFDGLGATRCQQGRFVEAIQAHRSALDIEPGNAKFHSNLLLSLNYLPEHEQAAVQSEKAAWQDAHQLAVSFIGRHANSIDSTRRLRIGYVSPDFRTHSVSYFLEPLLENHDRDDIEIYCYPCTPHHDETTSRLQQLSDGWRDISALGDRQAAELIASDEIDILVDLAGHTARNRLALFTASPAPVQVTWLGYPGSTGLDAIDYRITDEAADPPGNDELYNEQLVRVPGCFLCYKPPALDIPVSQAPCISNGYITFGSFNNLAKINEDVIDLWAKLLHEVEQSRLIIKNPSLTDEPTADKYRSLFEKRGIPSSRVELLGLAPTITDHLNTYGQIDIALDTFPYNGTTTTCEAMYMGVPVVTLTGRLHANRVGNSLLHAVGLDELIAGTPDSCISIASTLAEDCDRISRYREDLRSAMQSSRLCDGEVFARNMEAAYRDMWRRWCDAQQV